MKLWLDQLTEPPAPDWTWVKTVEEAIALMETGTVTHASIGTVMYASSGDDVGLDSAEVRTLVPWMAEHEHWPEQELMIHSARQVDVEHMAEVIERYGPFERDEPGGSRFVRWDDED